MPVWQAFNSPSARRRQFPVLFSAVDHLYLPISCEGVDGLWLIARFFFAFDRGPSGLASKRNVGTASGVCVPAVASPRPPPPPFFRRGRGFLAPLFAFLRGATFASVLDHAA